jgi:hypothetical protein
MSLMTLPWRSPLGFVRAALEKMRGGASGPLTETSPWHEDPRLRTRLYRASLGSLRNLLEGVVPQVERWGRPLTVKSRSNEGDQVFTMHVEAKALWLRIDMFVKAREDGGRVRVDAVAQPRPRLNDLGESERAVAALLEAIDKRLGRFRDEEQAEA